MAREGEEVTEGLAPGRPWLNKGMKESIAKTESLASYDARRSGLSQPNQKMSEGLIRVIADDPELLDTFLKDPEKAIFTDPRQRGPQGYRLTKEFLRAINKTQVDVIESRKRGGRELPDAEYTEIAEKRGVNVHGKGNLSDVYRGSIFAMAADALGAALGGKLVGDVLGVPVRMTESGLVYEVPFQGVYMDEGNVVPGPAQVARAPAAPAPAPAAPAERLEMPEGANFTGDLLEQTTQQATIGVAGGQGAGIARSEEGIAFFKQQLRDLFGPGGQLEGGSVPPIVTQFLAEVVGLPSGQLTEPGDVLNAIA